MMKGSTDAKYSQKLPMVRRDDILAFQTSQRLHVMLIKTAIIHKNDRLSGPQGPVRCSLPASGHCSYDSSRGLKTCRLSETVMILVDCFAATCPKDRWSRLLAHAHGVLLRRLGKTRVVYLIRHDMDDFHGTLPTWRTNPNLVTGVADTWLEATFEAASTSDECIIVGLN